MKTVDEDHTGIIQPGKYRIDDEGNLLVPQDQIDRETVPALARYVIRPNTPAGVFGVRPSKKKSRNQWGTTPQKLQRLRAIREVSKRDGKVTIGRLQACSGVVDPATVRTHDPDLWANWENYEY